MKIASAQINPILGDIEHNKNLIISSINRAKAKNADIVIFPELSLTGYPLNDLVYELDFLRKQKKAIKEILYHTENIIACVTFVDFTESIITHDKTCSKYNAVAVIQNKNMIGIRYKSLLPNYDVFHEERYFQSAEEIEPVSVKINKKNYKLGLEICEDLWDEHYRIKVSRILAKKGADIIINLSASPFEVDKFIERQRMVQAYVAELKVPFVYCNMIGGQDEIIFDGNSFAYNAKNELISCSDGFKESLSIFNTNQKKIITLERISTNELIYNALILGIRDYFRKNKLKTALIGLSGGVDSALVTLLAVEALGAENVQVLSLPSKYSSQHSLDDASELAKISKLDHCVISIESYHALFESMYPAWFPDQEITLTDENLQARLRGLILMAFCNQNNKILLTTGNKTEIALGYCTLYGDMNGALAVIGDLSKNRVYELCHFINEKHGENVIPLSILTKAPSAELRDGQIDPFDYNSIAPLVDKIIEERCSRKELLEAGYNTSIVNDLFKRIFNSEFKRFQAAVILKVTSKSFGLGRLYPMTNHYKG